MAEINGVMMQYFHWYLPADGTLWNDISSKAAEIARAGITALWLPPAYKGIGGADDVGYGVYDLYDLGEFEQKGSLRTKYGTRGQYLAAVEALRAAGVQIYADAVLNHRMGADRAETCLATPYRKGDRCNPKGPQREISSWTNFTFPGRTGAIPIYSGTGITSTPLILRQTVPTITAPSISSPVNASMMRCHWSSAISPT